MTWAGSDPTLPEPAPVGVVALGGGHGLSASLSALRRVVRHLTAVVTVADNGGSSGRLRHEFGVLPPGDLRQALAALCGDDDWGQTWARVLQHRFASTGPMDEHAVGNLLIVALWELLGDHVRGLEWVARLLGAQGTVLPMSVTPIDITAAVHGADPAAPGRVEHGARPGRGGLDHRAGGLGGPVAGGPARLPRGARSGPPRRTGSCWARARGSPASSRTCWCPSSARRSYPQPDGARSPSTSRPRPGRPTATRPRHTWRSSPPTPPTCGWTWCSSTRTCVDDLAGLRAAAQSFGADARRRRRRHGRRHPTSRPGQVGRCLCGFLQEA